MSIILKQNKRTLTKDYLVKVAKQTNSNMYLEWQDLSEKKAIKITNQVAKNMGYKVS